MAHRFKLSNKKYILLALVILALGIGFVYFPSRHPREKSIIPSSVTNHSSITSPSTQNVTSPNSVSSSNPKYAAPTAASGNLAAPFGTFVSNHRPSLSGTSQQKAEQSICNTSPGATCYIQFTNGSIIKSLETQTVNDSGAAFWSWDISDSGLTAGTWQVEAIASLNSQTKTANDPINLEVQP